MLSDMGCFFSQLRKEAVELAKPSIIPAKKPNSNSGLNTASHLHLYSDVFSHLYSPFAVGRKSLKSSCP